MKKDVDQINIIDLSVINRPHRSFLNVLLFGMTNIINSIKEKLNY